MNCKKPNYRILKGQDYLKWGTVKDFQEKRAIAVRCLKCINCKIARMQNWKNKLLLETTTTIKNNGHIYFITLTYDDKNISKTKDLNGEVAELQKMFKRIRKNNKNLKMKYFFVNELGSNTGRIHHHGIIFSNINFLEKKSGGTRINHNYYYQNDNINWKNGFHSITKLEKQENKEYEKGISYVLKYLTKNPLGYLFSRKIGYEQMLKNADIEKGIYLVNGKIKKISFIKNTNNTDTKLKNSYEIISKTRNILMKENLKQEMEIKQW